MIEMDFKESHLEQTIQYNGDERIVFTTLFFSFPLFCETTMLNKFNAK